MTSGSTPTRWSPASTRCAGSSTRSTATCPTTGWCRRTPWSSGPAPGWRSPATTPWSRSPAPPAAASPACSTRSPGWSSPRSGCAGPPPASRTPASGGRWTAANRLLDWIGVLPRHRFVRESALDGDDESALHGLVLLDLPDFDSVERSPPAGGGPAARPGRPGGLGGRPAEVRRPGRPHQLPARVPPAPRRHRGRAQPGRPAAPGRAAPGPGRPAPAARRRRAGRRAAAGHHRRRPGRAWSGCARRWSARSPSGRPRCAGSPATWTRSVAGLDELVGAGPAGRRAGRRRPSARCTGRSPPRPGCRRWPRRSSGRTGTGPPRPPAGRWSAGWRRLRPDPLRRLHLPGPAADRRRRRRRAWSPRPRCPTRPPRSARRSGWPIRAVADRAGARTCPAAWPAAVTAAARSRLGDLPDALDRAVAGTDLGTGPPAALVAGRRRRCSGWSPWPPLAGLGWLVARLRAARARPAGAGATRRSARCRCPPLLLLGGLLAGLLVAAADQAGRPLGRPARPAPGRAAAHARAVAEVGEEYVLTPGPGGARLVREARDALRDAAAPLTTRGQRRRSPAPALRLGRRRVGGMATPQTPYDAVLHAARDVAKLDYALDAEMLGAALLGSVYAVAETDRDAAVREFVGRFPRRHLPPPHRRGDHHPRRLRRAGARRRGRRPGPPGRRRRPPGPPSSAGYA